MGRKKYSKELKARIALDAIKGQKTISVSGRKNACRDLLGKRSCQEDSMINTMKNKLKYTLTHKKYCP